MQRSCNTHKDSRLIVIGRIVGSGGGTVVEGFKFGVGGRTNLLFMTCGDLDLEKNSIRPMPAPAICKSTQKQAQKKK